MNNFYSMNSNTGQPYFWEGVEGGKGVRVMVFNATFNDISVIALF